MRLGLGVCLLLVSASIAGCSDGQSVPAKPKVSIGLITPGTWHVGGNTDYMLAWFHNEASSQVGLSINVTRANSTTLPANWTLTVSKASSTLQPAGTKTQSGGRYTYPDWAWALLTLKIPANETAGTHAMKVGGGGNVHSFSLVVAAPRARVSAPGDQVTVQYAGSFNDSGEAFDDGEFPTRLGSGQTVPGFDNGLMGLAVGEQATLIIPPALAYGYDNTDPGYTKFNGRTLRFDVEIKKFG